MQRELQDQERKTELFNSRRESHRMSVEPATLQSLQRQVSDRDKKIEELTSQLEALKRIDQEMRGKTRPIKPPSSFVPSQQSEPPKP
jgi:predicted RNase H-like nuclease (RuvC/YqgF family)